MSAAVALIPEVPSARRAAWRPRRPFRVPDGLPKGRDNWRVGAAVSAVLHLLLLLLIVAPFAIMKDITLIEQGAGGAGPAGGGGGGARGTGGIRRETLRYVTLAPPPPPAPVVPAVVQAPVQPPIELPQAELPRVEAPKVSAPVPVVGTGGGTGNDGTTGTGPGSGGGVGSGVGTGKGSGIGPGTGGGRQENYPPSSLAMFIPPLPVPSSVRGAKIVVQFDVDETGRVRGIEFTETRDRGYNRRLRQVFEEFTFKPGTRPDGTPVRMKFQMEYELP